MYSLLEEKERSSDAPLSSFAVDVAKHDREDRTRLVGGVGEHKRWAEIVEGEEVRVKEKHNHLTEKGRTPKQKPLTKIGETKINLFHPI